MPPIQGRMSLGGCVPVVRCCRCRRQARVMVRRSQSSSHQAPAHPPPTHPPSGDQRAVGSSGAAPGDAGRSTRPLTFDAPVRAVHLPIPVDADAPAERPPGLLALACHVLKFALALLAEDADSTQPVVPSGAPLLNPGACRDPTPAANDPSRRGLRDPHANQSTRGCASDPCPVWSVSSASHRTRMRATLDAGGISRFAAIPLLEPDSAYSCDRGGRT